MSIVIEGNWLKGKAFDFHTIHSTCIGVNEYGHKQYDHTYSEMGKLVHELKYQNNRTAVQGIVNLLDEIKNIENFNFLIPAPATNKSRPFQPVDEIVKALGERRRVEALVGFLEADTNQQLKNVDDLNQRKTLLKNAIRITGKRSISGCKILLVDDIFDTGSTLSAATEILCQGARVESVCVLTMTKTRRRQ